MGDRYRLMRPRIPALEAGSLCPGLSGEGVGRVRPTRFFPAVVTGRKDGFKIPSGKYHVGQKVLMRERLLFHNLSFSSSFCKHLLGPNCRCWGFGGWAWASMGEPAFEATLFRTRGIERDVAMMSSAVLSCHI